MKPLTLQEIRQAVGGRSATPLDADAPIIRAVCTDTRAMQPQSLFVAIRGDTHDGHKYLATAQAGGAVAAIVENLPSEPISQLHYIVVPDTRVALGRLGTLVRRQFRGKVIAVAGSNGKTGTKYLIQAVLSSKLKGSASPKSFNNEIGVPLTILPADPGWDYLVLEMGTNHHGEILRLTEMALPDIAVITNCGAEHLEGLTDLAGVIRENASIIHGLKPNGLLVVNGDDPALLEAVSGYRGKRVTFGHSSSCDLFAADILTDFDGLRFRLNNSRLEVFVPLLGRHNAINALAAIAVGKAMRLDEPTIVASLATAKGPDMRLQLHRLDRLTLINDAYNANPSSMWAALQTLADLPTSGRRVAILGDMRELGVHSESYHRQTGRQCAELGLDLLIGVGNHAQWIIEGAAQAGAWRERLVHFPDSASAAYGIDPLLQNEDLVLLKGSRGIHLERVAQAILEGHHARPRT